MECNVCKLCVRLIVCLFVCLSVCPSVCLSVCLSVCPSVCLSVCVYVTGRLPACAHVVCMLVCCMYYLYQKSSMNVSNICLYNPQKTSACHVSNSGANITRHFLVRVQLAQPILFRPVDPRSFCKARRWQNLGQHRRQAHGHLS